VRAKCHPEELLPGHPAATVDPPHRRNLEGDRAPRGGSENAGRAGAFSIRTPALPYSPSCVEEEFSEVRIQDLA
jgi:hypothetical protein